MRPASYLTAPPRVAAKIIAPLGSGYTVVTMARSAGSDLDFAAFLPGRGHRHGRRGGRARAAHPAGGTGAVCRGHPRGRTHLARSRGGRATGGRALGGERGAHGRRRAAPALPRAAADPPRRRRAGAQDARLPPRAASEMTRVAAIDLGTNATRLLVADVEDGHVEEIVRRTRITRLGEGVDARRRLLPAPIARVRNTLADYRRELEALGAERTLAVATSAVRDAENGEAFLGEVEWSYGFATRLLSGDEEAALTLRGVGPLPAGTVVVDVGGGSTELITETFRLSMDVGSVRLTERFGDDEDAAAAHIRTLLPDLHATQALGVDGTTAELAFIGGSPTVTLTTIDESLAWLADSTEEERRARLLEPDRSEVLAAGVLILRETLRHLGLDSIDASERDLLNGAALEAAALPGAPEGDAPPGAYTCC